MLIKGAYSFFGIKDKLKNTRFNMFIIIFIISIFAYFFRDFIDLSVFAAGLSLTLSIPMIYIFWGKDFLNQGNKSTSRFLFSTIFSFLGLIIGISIIGLDPSAAVFPLLFGVIGLFINIKPLNKI